MEELSFLDKLKILVDNVLDHPLFTLLLFVPIVVFFLHRKHGKKVFVIIYFLVIFALFFSFGDIIFQLFDNLMDGLFMTLYFPNFITLFAVVVLCSLFALVSLFSQRMNKVIKVINYISFGIIQSLFALVLITIKANKINIYKDNALYTNNDVLTLMQLLIGTFALQVLSILILKGIDRLTNILDRKERELTLNINKQISALKESKIKPVNIDNNKIGYINVADKASTSKPLLKPFKFDINKIESIKIDDSLYTPNPVIDDKDIRYLNEVVKTRKFKPIVLDSSKIAYLKVTKRSFNRVILENKNVTYLNEVIRRRKFKPIKIDSEKIVNLKVHDREFNLFVPNDKNFSYLNEVINKPLVTRVNLDSNKIVNLDVQDKSYKYSSIDKEKMFNLDVVDLKDKKNEVKRKFKPANIDFNKNINIKSSDSSSEENADLTFKFGEDLLRPNNKSFDYNKEVIQKETSSDVSEFDKIFKSKPDLTTNNKIKPIMIFPSEIVASKKVNLVDNLVIIDIQSTLDVASKYHFMKGVKLKGYNKMSVDNLKIYDFDLLTMVLKKYKLMR